MISLDVRLSHLGLSRQNRPADVADRLLEVLLNGCEASRNTMDSVLLQISPEAQEIFRSRLCDHLEDQGATLCQQSANDAPKARSSLSWVLYAIGRVSGADERARAAVARYAGTERQEHGWRWVQYWGLAGLARSKGENLRPIVEPFSKHSEPVVSVLADAMLAREGDSAALDRVRSAIARGAAGQSREDPDVVWCWAALRAMRVCFLNEPAVVERICDIVKIGDNSDLTYDALKAGYHVTPGSELAAAVVLSLIAFVQKWRDFTGRDAMRALALIGLGKLRDATAEPTLLDQLTDNNPAIVREAALSLEKVLGTPAAVQRIQERALHANVGAVRAYADALRRMEDRESVVAALCTPMASGSPEYQQCCYTLLSELGGAAAIRKLRARTELMDQYQTLLRTTEEKIEKLFEDSLGDARRGFRHALAMDLAVFWLGLFLIAVSAALAMIVSGDLTAWSGAVGATAATGATGVLGVLYGVLVAKPRNGVTAAVDHLMSLKVVFLAYLRELFQSDQAYARCVIEGDTPSVEELDRFAMRIEKGMTSAVQSIARLRASPSPTHVHS